MCALLCATALLLGGCSAFDTGGELFSLPKVAGFVTELQTEIDAVLAEGGEYAAPVSGTNRQSVQMEDLDGDGGEEAILFIRTADALKICVFRQDEQGGYSRFAEVEGYGTNFDSIGYADLIGDGRRELLVGISVGSGMPKALSVVSLGEDGPKELLSATYTGYTALDLNGDGSRELIIARHDAEYSSGVAEVYRFSEENGKLEMDASTPLSAGISSLRRIKTGYLRDATPAVFITGLTSADGSERMITDVCAYRNGSLVNVTLNPETGQSVEVVANVGANGEDIDGDGIFDLPMPVILSSYNNRATNDVFRKIVWRNYTVDGVAEEVMQTFHNTSDGWYLVLPELWESANLAVDRRSTSNDERVIVFSIVSDEGEATPVLEIYSLTGENRISRSKLPGRVVISNAYTRTVASTIYAVRLGDLEGTEFERYLPTVDEVADSFKFIQTEWLTGELTS